MFFLVLLAVLASSIWVFFDAQSIGVRKGMMPGLFDMGPLLWALACIALWILFFPAYIAKRGEYRQLIASGRHFPAADNSGGGTGALIIGGFLLLTIVGGLLFMRS